MKATNSSSEQERKKQPLYGPTGTSRAETAVFTTLGITALVAVVIAVASSLAPAESRKKPLAAVVTYVRSGWLDADLRTAAEMVHYCCESESPMATNVIRPGPAQKILTMPTNDAANRPKA